MKILHIDQNHPLLLEKLKRAGFSNVEGYSYTKEETKTVIHRYHGIVIRSRFNIDRPFIDAAKNLKFIARVGAGLENIATAHAKKKGIKLFAAPEGNRNAVGEHTLAMLLALFNKLNLSDRDIRAGNWAREAHRGVELEGKTIGIIGYGNMGRSFAKKLKGFNCTLLCHDIKKGVGNKNAAQVPLKTLQKMADVVSLHTPWTPQTDKMVDSKFINAFKKPFWLLNTARGKNVVTADLVPALKSGKIRGAGLDVLEYEKPSFGSLFQDLGAANKQTGAPVLPNALKELITFPNVILSPHVAGWTVESNVKLANTIAEKILGSFKP
ncbi:MAG: 2-hydroxyacid dehydrogenase [Marinirhabdus sp.]